MPYDEGLATRITDALEELPDPVEYKKMFGGLCVMVRGHMVAGIVGEELMVRVGKDAWESSLARPHAREMDFTGRSLKGMVYVGVEGFRTDDGLQDWLDLGIAHARSLPPKKKK